MQRMLFNWHQLFCSSSERGNEAKWRQRHRADIAGIITSEWHKLKQAPNARGKKKKVLVCLPDDVALKWAVLVALRWGLPLDHDGLIGASTRHDGLRGCTGRLLGESQTAAKGKQKRGQKGKRRDKKKWSHTLIIRNFCIFQSHFTTDIKPAFCIFFIFLSTPWGQVGKVWFCGFCFVFSPKTHFLYYCPQRDSLLWQRRDQRRLGGKWEQRDGEKDIKEQEREIHEDFPFKSI